MIFWGALDPYKKEQIVILISILGLFRNYPQAQIFWKNKKKPSEKKKKKAKVFIICGFFLGHLLGGLPWSHDWKNVHRPSNSTWRPKYPQMDLLLKQQKHHQSSIIKNENAFSLILKMIFPKKNRFRPQWFFVAARRRCPPRQRVSESSLSPPGDQKFMSTIQFPTAGCATGVAKDMKVAPSNKMRSPGFKFVHYNHFLANPHTQRISFWSRGCLMRGRVPIFLSLNSEAKNLKVH